MPQARSPTQTPSREKYYEDENRVIYTGKKHDIVNSIKFVEWFGNSVYGGGEGAHVYKVENGELIEEAPIVSHRGEDGRFGWGVWYLPPGVYIVVDITRLNDVNVEAYPTLITLARLNALANRILKFHLFSLYRVKIDKVIVHKEPIDKAWGWRYEREPLLVEVVVDLSDVKRLIVKAKERCPECAPTPSSKR